MEIADCRLSGTNGLRQWPQNFNFVINGEMRNLEINWGQSQEGVQF